MNRSAIFFGVGMLSMGIALYGTACGSKDPATPASQDNKEEQKSQDCASDEWGEDCQKCNCDSMHICDTRNGSCDCKNGKYGDNCDEDCLNPLMAGPACDYCKNGKFGPNCDQDCEDPLMTGPECDLCINGLLGEQCDCQDDHTYKSATINGLIWMTENLQNSCFDVLGPNNNLQYASNYGYLYTWKMAMRACPSGWRLPTITEYEDMLAASCEMDTLNPGERESTCLRSKTWLNGTNSSGFTALPAGVITEFGDIWGFEDIAFFWSSSEIDENHAGALSIYSEIAEIEETGKDAYYSVRCVKEE